MWWRYKDKIPDRLMHGVISIRLLSDLLSSASSVDASVPVNTPLLLQEFPV